MTYLTEVLADFLAKLLIKLSPKLWAKNRAIKVETQRRVMQLINDAFQNTRCDFIVITEIHNGRLNHDFISVLYEYPSQRVSLAGTYTNYRMSLLGVWTLSILKYGTYIRKDISTEKDVGFKNRMYREEIQGLVSFAIRDKHGIARAVVSLVYHEPGRVTSDDIEWARQLAEELEEPLRSFYHHSLRQLFSK